MITLKVEGLVEGTEGEDTIHAMVNIFERCLNIALVKNQQYRGAWKKQGWMGNLARIMSKMERLKALCWVDGLVPYTGESVEDNLVDLINIAAFMEINFEDGNRWGS
jgi:hypothetical protein